MAGGRRFTKVLVLGMDGLDPVRVGGMVHAGEMPAFARLKRCGNLGKLATSNPAESPVAWSSLATGCNPGRHGIFDFIHRDPAGYVPRLSLLADRKKASRAPGASRFRSPLAVPGFWRFTSDAGLPTTVIRWPVTFPAESVKGNFLAGLGVPDVAGRLGRHTFYTTSPDATGDDKVVPVVWRDDRIDTHLAGPPVGGVRSGRPARAKLTIQRSGKGLSVSLGSQFRELKPRQWSDWFNVSFRWGPIRVCDALVKFYLVSVRPELRLFATPVQINPRNQLYPLTQPENYGAELSEQIGSFYTLGLPEDTNAVTDGRYDLDGFLQQYAEIHRERRAMFEYELNRFADGVLAFVFDAGDRVQHMFWSVEDENSPTYESGRAKRYGRVVPDLYREMDDVLATALDAADDDTAIFVVSDHGFGPFHRAVHLNRWLIDNGFMMLKGDGEGGSLFADVDWSRTQAYAVGFTSIYLNRAGRESRGIVDGGTDTHEAAGDIMAGLRAVRDPASGARMIREVYLGDDLYTGDQAPYGPDLVVGFEPGYRASWQTALGGAPREIAVDNDKLWAADHLVDPSAVPGVLATNVLVTAARPNGVDLAPTVLRCLDLPVPTYMDGRSWLDEDLTVCLRAEERESHPFEPELVGVTPTSIDSDGLTERERAELEQHLGDLGYL